MEIEIGINIIEIVTKGLYPNSPDIFREYIQNSCDAIDDAVASGVLNAGEGKIEIFLDSDTRTITIEDNGEGLGTRDFERTLKKIGNSDKTLETYRGFRGIGRLCGLAYCKQARFTSTRKGETKLSTLTINAERLRQEFFSSNKYSAESVLRDVMAFDKTDTDADQHFFRVELLGIVETNNALLDAEKVRDYLSFVAPVEYQNNFLCTYGTEIYNHAQNLNFKITEYRINVNGEQVVKNYKTTLTTRNGKDEIFGVSFRDFYDADGNLIAWSWIGLSSFKGVLSEKRGTADNKMRGIRLRTGNIQIGDAEVFKKLFTEGRGTNYFIGEVHTVDKNLRPNSRRDYFEENESCNTLESELEKYFLELYEIYRTASELRSAQSAVAKPAEFVADFAKKSANYQKSNRETYENDLAKLQKIAATKSGEIVKARRKAEENSDTALSKVILRMTRDNASTDAAAPPRLGGQSLKLQRFRLRLGEKICANFTTRLKK